jgi:hypothetical protein
VTSNDGSQREERRLKEVAAQYRKKGYKVLLRPSDTRLPSFLKGHRPDLVVTKGARHVVIEVKSKDSLADADALPAMAAAVEGQKGWSFEMVLTNPRASSKAPAVEPVTLTRASTWITEAKELYSTHSEAGFVLAWMAFEAIAQRLIHAQTTEKRWPTPRNLPKSLFSLGFVNRRQLKTLEEAQDVRNHLVHGLWGIPPIELFETLLVVVADLHHEAREMQREQRS